MDHSAEMLRKEARSIFRAFEDVSLNGVICSIPDEGLDMRPHRVWCARCQKLWKRVHALGNRDE